MKKKVIIIVAIVSLLNISNVFAQEETEKNLDEILSKINTEYEIDNTINIDAKIEEKIRETIDDKNIEIKVKCEKNKCKVKIKYNEIASAEKDITVKINNDASTQVYIPNIKYKTHIQSYGWLSEVSNGELSGTTGQGKRIESMSISLDNYDNGNILYQSYIEGKGWEDWKSNGELSGTTGQAKRIEAIKIKLDGEILNQYDVYYRVHSQSYGWLGWTKNGEVAGTTGYAKRIEAIQIRLIEKNQTIDEFNEEKKSYLHPNISYQTYLQTYAWQNKKNDGEVAGTTGQSKRVEAIKIKNETGIEGKIIYQTYSEEEGWQQEVSDNELSGSMGKYRAIEAIKIKLDGEILNQYDVYYRVHSQSYGWLGWTKNGEVAGTTGYAKRIEAIQIRLIEKNQTIDEFNEEKKSYLHPNISYQTYLQTYAWQNKKNDGEVAGTTGQSKRVEAIKIKNETGIEGKIIYQTYSEEEGWQQEVSDNELSGSMGKYRAIEAIKIRLDGTLANQYDIYYSLHVQKLGWLNWAKNGEATGTVDLLKNVEAIKIILVSKDENFTESLGNNYYESGNIQYSSYYNSEGWSDYTKYISGSTGNAKSINGIKVDVPDIDGKIIYGVKFRNNGYKESYNGTELCSSDEIDYLRIRLEGAIANKYDVYYRVHVRNLGWLDWTKNNNKTGTENFKYAIEAYQIKLVPKPIVIDTGKSIFFEKFIPTYYSQVDWRWKYSQYGLSTMGGTGCSPTSMAMAFSGILKREILPTEVANYLYFSTNEFNKYQKGTSGLGIIYATNQYGIKREGIGSIDELNYHLQHGKIIYAAMANGRFAKPWYNHAIIVFNDDNNNTIAYDPLNYSNGGYVSIYDIWREKSNDWDDLRGGYALYALSK